MTCETDYTSSLWLGLTEEVDAPKLKDISSFSSRISSERTSFTHAGPISTGAPSNRKVIKRKRRQSSISSGTEGASVIGQAQAEQKATSPESDEVLLDRICAAINRSGLPLDEVFRGFCGTEPRGTPGNYMSLEGLKRLAAAFEYGVKPDAVVGIWRACVSDDAPGLDYPTFRSCFRANSGFSRVVISADQPYPSLSESGILSNLLEASGTTRDNESPSGEAVPDEGNIKPLASTLSRAADSSKKTKKPHSQEGVLLSDRFGG